MTASCAGRTGEHYDLLMDEIAATCATGDPVAISILYEHADLPVPATLIS